MAGSLIKTGVGKASDWWRNKGKEEEISESSEGLWRSKDEGAKQTKTLDDIKKGIIKSNESLDTMSKITSAGANIFGTKGTDALTTGGSIAEDIGFLKYLPMILKVLLVGAAGVAGYAVGTKINEKIDAKMTDATGGKNTSLGSWLYDKEASIFGYDKAQARIDRAQETYDIKARTLAKLKRGEVSPDDAKKVFEFDKTPIEEGAVVKAPKKGEASANSEKLLIESNRPQAQVAQPIISQHQGSAMGGNQSSTPIINGIDDYGIALAKMVVFK
jgi:hypothetical protein